MSARLLRRVLKEREEQLPAPSEADMEPDSGEDEPRSSSRNPFDLLDDQEDEQELDGVDREGDVDEEESIIVRKSSDTVPASNQHHKSKKKKKKKKKNKEKSASTKPRDEKSLDLILEGLCVNKSSENDVQLKDVKAVSNEVQANTKKHDAFSILEVDAKHLKAENELRRIFGSKVVNSFENSQSGGSSRQTYGGRRGVVHNPRKTVLTTPASHWPRWDGSLSMEPLETKNGLHYFRYVHSPSYAHVQEAFEAAKSINDLNAIASIFARNPYHIDSLLTFAEFFKFQGDHQQSADMIGKCLYALESAWHPQFNPLRGNYRLKYIHDANKPLFSALFCHMKNLDRRGCHRSALEVCKLLLSLDSDDPKGTLFCIDYFALRGKQYRWLEQFAEDYRSDNSLWLFPNFSYSLAVCRFYLEQEDTSQTEKAVSIDLMKQALMLHPLVLQKLVDKAPLKDSAWTQILKNPFFGSAKAGSPSLDHLINIYVERSYIIWRFPELQKFLKEAALLVIETLKQNSSEARDWACVRKEAFSSDKNDYSHLMVSDFSDSIPSIPPEELRHLMAGPQIMLNMPNADRDAIPEGVRAPREVAGRNALAVLLESVLPWVDYGDNRNGHPDGHGDNINQ